MIPQVKASPVGNTPFTDRIFWNNLYPQNRYKERTAFALNFLLAKDQPENTVLTYIETLKAKNPERLTQKDPENSDLTPLHIAAMKANSQAANNILAAAKNQIEVRRMLNQQDAFGYTPLHMAALTSDVLYQTFLNQGADPSIKNARGGTPADLLSLTGRVTVLRSKDTLFFEDPATKEVHKVALMSEPQLAKLFPVGFIHTDSPLYRSDRLHQLWLDNANLTAADLQTVSNFERRPPHLLIRECKEIQGDEKPFELVSREPLRRGVIISEYAGLSSKLTQPKGFADAFAEVSQINAYATERFDSRLVGNESRFANCGFPNAMLRTLVYKGSPHSFLIATKDIEEGEPIVWDYGITMTHLVFGRQVLFNKESMRQFYLNKTSETWAQEAKTDIKQFQTITNPKAKERNFFEINVRHETYMFAINNPTALLYLFFSESVDLNLWMKDQPGNTFLQEFKQNHSFEWRLLLCIFETLKRAEADAKASDPEIKKLFYSWVLRNLEKIPLLDLLKGIEHILDTGLNQKDIGSFNQLLQSTDQFLENYDWKVDPLYPFNLDRRARLSLTWAKEVAGEKVEALLINALRNLPLTLGEGYETTELYQISLKSYYLLNNSEGEKNS